MGEQRTMRETLGMLYTQGWAIDWSALYATGSRCVDLPSYAWQRERYWLPDIELESGTAQIVPQRRSAIQQHQQGQHPLLLHYMHLAHPVEYHAWEVELDPAELAYLEDHQILGERVMPGVAFVEMALAAATSITDGRPCALTEVTFVRLLTFPERSSRIVQIVISSANGGEASFSISSRLAGAAASQQAGTLHVTGKIDYHQSLVPPVEHSAPCDVQARCSQELAGETYYRHLRERGYQYGRAMKHIKHIWSKQGEILALLHFEATEIAGAYLIHPTILEAGAQALLAGLPMEEGAGNVYVPVSINRVVYHRRALSDSLWSHVRLQETTGIGAPVLEGDIYLLDDTGNVLVEAQGVRFQHLERGGSRGIPAEAAQWLYVLQWREQTLPRNPISDRQLARSADTWIVLGDDCEMSTELAASLRTRGERCTQIITGEIYNYLDDDHICIHPDELGHFERALTDIFAKAHTDTLNIVCLGSADAKPLQVSTWNPLELALSSGCIGILYLIQALDRYHRSMKLRVWLVTHGAQDAGGEGCRTEAALTQAPLWGLGRTLLHEYPHLSCTLVDIDNVGTQRAVEALLHEFAIGDAERQVVLRANRRYLARLAHYALPNLPSSFEPLGTGTTLLLFHQDATYLVTGGLGGIGLVLTRWLIEQGARHVTLLGRHAPSQAVQVMLNDMMQATGAHITVLQADVAKTEDVVNALMHITHPPLRGVFHLAGTLDDGLLTHLDRQRFQTVMAPKVQGAWNLHAHTLDMPLDYFVLFSSAAAMPGSPGQGNYAAANAFLDTLAHFRRKLGLPALSINWGPWSEIGLAAQGARGKRLVLRGIESLTPTQGLRLLEWMLYAIRSDQAQVPAQVGVLPIASDQLNRIAATAAMNALFSEIQGSRSGSRSVEGMRIRSGGLRPTLLEMESEQRRSTLEQYLREQVARVLRNSSTMLNAYEPLTSFGLDSLMTMELKNQLEEDLELGIPIAMLLQDPSIRELTTHLLEQLAGGDDSDPTADLPLPPIESVTATGEYTGQRYPLSYAQERMWFFEKAVPGSTGPGDNLPVGARLIGPLHPEALLQSFEELVRRHDVLRTSFVTHQGRPLQAIRPYQVKEQTQEMHTSSNLALSLFDLTKWSRPEQEAEVTRLFREEQYFTFDLESDALLRVKLIRLAEKEWILLLNMHHIISDAWSLGILMSELGMLYVALSQGEPSPLPPLSIQYADYAVWQHRWLRGAILERQLAYWSTQLAEAPTLLPLPTDYRRPPVRSYAGACFSFTLSEDVSKGIIALSRSEGVTLFMTLLAAFTLLLHHYGGQEDIVIGSITAGRVRAEIEGLIGLFTNLVALRIQIKDGNITFRELLQHVQAVTLDGYAHQDVPLQTVVEHLGIIQDPSYTTLFQVMFVLQNTPLSNGITQLGDLEIQPLGSEWVQWEAELAPCDLELHMFESEEGILRGNLYYSTELFERTTIERLMAWFQDILKRIGVDSKRRVNEFIFQVSEEQTPP
jgi:aryl carrier-like protein